MTKKAASNITMDFVVNNLSVKEIHEKYNYSLATIYTLLGLFKKRSEKKEVRPAMRKYFGFEDPTSDTTRHRPSCTLISAIVAIISLFILFFIH